MSATQVLVVDDDARYAASVCELLRTDGHAVAFEVDGARALERIQADEIPVLILDLDMPGVSGVDVLKALQTRTQRPKTIIVSGVADVEKLTPVLRLGSYDYFAKPYDPKHLLTSVRDAFVCIRRDGDNRARLEARATDRLAGAIAHDLNNILADIIGYTELALGSTTGTGHLKEVLTAGQRTRDLISQILMFTRRDPADTGAAVSDLPTGRVVIVDHEVSIGDSIGDVLHRVGYNVAVFSDAAAALDHIAASSPDVALVLTDQALPQIPGAQFAERLRELPDAPPVVIMVGYADRADRQCAPVLNKPFRVGELLDVVRAKARRDPYSQ